MYAAKRSLFSIYYLAITALVDFTTAMSTYIDTRFYGDGYQVSEAFEKAGAEFLAFFCEFEDFPFFLAYVFLLVRDQSSVFELLKEWID